MSTSLWNHETNQVAGVFRGARLISKDIANEYANGIMNVWRKNADGAFITSYIKVILSVNADTLLSHVGGCMNCGARDAPEYAALGGREIWYNGISSGVTPGHEFGYILGLNHHYYENKIIMSKYFSNLRVINETDVDAMINLYGGGDEEEYYLYFIFNNFVSGKGGELW